MEHNDFTEEEISNAKLFFLDKIDRQSIAVTSIDNNGVQGYVFYEHNIGYSYNPVKMDHFYVDVMLAKTDRYDFTRSFEIAKENCQCQKPNTTLNKQD